MLRKEFKQQFRGMRLVVVSLIFLLIGFGSPLLASALPALLAKGADPNSAMAIVLTRAPDLTDAMGQYLKNFGNLPIMVILLGMGCVAGERVKGTLPMVISKPLDRKSYVLAKVLIQCTLCLIGTILASGACLLYSSILFGDVPLANYLLLNALLLLMLLNFVALTTLASVIAKSVGVAAGISVGGWILMTILASIPFLAPYTPSGLSSLAMNIALGQPTPDLVATVVAGGLWFFGLVAASLGVFSSQEI